MVARGAVRPCSQCGGVLDPFLSCNGCGTATVFADLAEVAPTLDCPECRVENPVLFLCRSCRTRSSFAVAAGGSPGAPVPQFACPICGAKVEASATVCPACGADFLQVERRARPRKDRAKRRLRGEYDEAAVNDVARVPGVGRARAEELCKAGFTAAWKIKAATEEELAKIPGVGPGGAKTIKDSLRFVLILSAGRTKEQLMDAEHACPLCGTVTSRFSRRCHDCGAGFDEEEIHDALRAELAREGDRSELAFYEVRLMEDQEDPDLWYARGLLLRDMDQLPDAISSFERALELAPGEPRILLARAAVFAQLKELGKAARQLRETAAPLLPPAEAAQEPVPEPGEGPLVPEPLEEIEEIEEIEEPEVEPPPESEEEPAEPEEPAPAVAPLEGEEAGVIEGRACPACGETVPSDAEVCPFCRAPLGGAEAIEPAESAPEGKFQPLDELEKMLFEAEHRPAARDRVTRGREILEVPPPKAPPALLPAIARRGLVNGQGLINGRGRVNGLVHRTGFVNGAELTQVRLPRAAGLTRYAVIAGALLMAIAIGIAVVPPPSGPAPRITVDGSVIDWGGIPLFLDPVASANPDVAIRSYGLYVGDGLVSVHVSVAGVALGDGVGLDAVYVFFDADGDPASGYRAGDLGAEAVLEVDGGNNTVADAGLYLWPPVATDSLNWSSFRRAGEVRAAAVGNDVEAQFFADELPLSPGFRARAYAEDFAGHQALGSVFFGAEPAALLVMQSVAPPSGIVASSGGAFLRLRFEAFGGPATVTAATLDHRGAGALGGVSSLPSVSPGTPALFDVPITFSAGDVGRSARGSVTSVSVSGGLPVTMAGEPAIAYLQTAPAGFGVDGYFGEWTSRAADTDSPPVTNPSLDIRQFQTALSGSTAYLYANTSGQILAGVAAPEIRIRPIPGPGGPQGAPGIPPRRTGEDVFRAYLDTNSSDTNGMALSGIYADHLLEVRGMNGRITSAQVYRWIGTWQATTANASAINNVREIEASVDLSGLPLSNMLVVLQSTDWSDGGDLTDPALTRGTGFQVLPLAAPWLGPLSTSPGAQAIAAPELAGALSVDGSCGDAGYAGAGTWTQTNMSIVAGTSAGFVWICIEASLDATNTTGDVADIHIDRDDSGEPGPGGGDRMFTVAADGLLSGFIGDGTGWTPCAFAASPTATECDAADRATAAMSPNHVYEFKIAFTDVWNTTSPTSNQRAGFAVRVTDAAAPATVYKWGSTSADVSSTDLNTWGHIDVPEFPEQLAAITLGTLVVLVVVRRARPKRPAPREIELVHP